MEVKNHLAYFLFHSIFFALFLAASDYSKHKDLDIKQYILFGVLFGLGSVLFNYLLFKMTKKSD